MLASSFMAPEQLGLTTEQHAALVEVLGVLEGGEVRHDPTLRDRSVGR